MSQTKMTDEPFLAGELLEKACVRADNVMYTKVGFSNRDHKILSLLQLMGIQPINWSKKFYKWRELWFHRLTRRIPGKYWKLKKFIAVWVFIL